MNGKATIVRDFERGDIDAVARLFRMTFIRRSGRKRSSPALISAIDQSFFQHPWQEPGIRSKVAVDAEGKLFGFIGVLPARFELGDRPVLAALAGSMMVEDAKANPLAGARLLRAFLAGPQDISLTETANATALGMWQKLGHAFDPAYSMSWLRVLRPVSTGLQLSERTLPAMRLAQPLGRIADRGLSLIRRSHFGKRDGRKAQFQDVGPSEFGRALLVLKNLYALHPRWDEDNTGWFLAQAEDKRNFGYPEWRVAYGPDGAPLAAYAYFAKVGGIAWVLQALAPPALTGELVDDLFSHAYEYGCAAVRGAAHPWLQPALMQRQAIFAGRAFYVAHSKDPSLLEPIRSGQALISGLAGEGWTPLIGGLFDD